MNNFEIHEKAQQLADTTSAYELARRLIQAEEVRAEAAPDAVWEALQRLIENAQEMGEASRDDAVLVAAYRDRRMFMPAIAWSGWCCQYPGRMPRLYGEREIAELNHDPENGDRLFQVVEMSCRPGRPQGETNPRHQAAADAGFKGAPPGSDVFIRRLREQHEGRCPPVKLSGGPHD